MFPETGKPFPNTAAKLTEAQYVAAVCQALRNELGTSRNAAKQIQRWTNVTDRTARNWINGLIGPSGHHLMCLASKSEAVLGAIVSMTARPELVLAADLHAVEVAIAKASGALEILKRQRSTRSG